MAASDQVWHDDLKRLARLLSGFSPRMVQGRNSPMYKAMRRMGQQWQGAMVKRFKGHPPGRTPPGSISSRSKALKASLQYVVAQGDAGPELILYSTSPYARTQEYGAIIIPRGHKYLTIPGKDNLTPTGKVRYKSFGEWFETAKAGGDVIIDSISHKSKAVLFRAKNLPRAKTMLQAYKQYKWMWTLTEEVTIRGPETTGEPSHLGFQMTWNRLRASRAVLLRGEMIRGIHKAVANAAARPD